MGVGVGINEIKNRNKKKKKQRKSIEPNADFWRRSMKLTSLKPSDQKKKEKEKKQNRNIRNERGDTAISFADSKSIKREYNEQLYVNGFENLEEMNKFWRETNKAQTRRNIT